MHSEKGLTAAVDWPARQAELTALLERQAKLYAMGDTSSLPVEIVRDLLQSIRFCVEAGLMGGESARQHSLEQLFRAGQLDIWGRTEQGKGLLRQAADTDPGYGSISLRDTLEELKTFFRCYDMRFFAHDIPCMIDYPLCRPVPEELRGILFIGEYLQRLALENRFCRCFAQHAGIRLLAAQQPLFRELVWNLFEPVFACAVGLAMLGRDPAPLQMDDEACGCLHGLLHPWREEDTAERLREAVNRLCVRFRLWDTAMRAYLLGAAEQLAPQLRAASRVGYCNLFGCGNAAGWE